LTVQKLAYTVSEREHWISATGGLLGTLAVLLVSQLLPGNHGNSLMIASMGASAVLLFAAPHGALSQPWPVMGGHLVSALVGVSCASWMDDPMLAASLAVALSIAAMYSLRCLHPPGGATALYAVMGGEAVHAMGYGYLLNPVLSNVIVLLIISVAFNYPFAWRRYPQAWFKSRTPKTEKAMIPHSRLVYALSQIDTFVDITEEDLLRIYELAMHDEAPVAQAAGNLAAQSTRA
jgi:CBS domain-containing membrane protein